MGKHKYSKDNQPDPCERKPRGKGKRTIMLEALKANGLNEQSFFEQMVERAVSGDGDPQMMKEVAARLYQVPKSTLPIVEFDLSEDESPIEQARSILKAVAKGNISPDVGKILTDMIQISLNIMEVTQLAEEIEKIKEAMASDGA